MSKRTCTLRQGRIYIFMVKRTVAKTKNLDGMFLST